jgi:hypothetical protein
MTGHPFAWASASDSGTVPEMSINRFEKSSFAERQADGRHDHTFDERRNDLSECRTDNYCNRQVDNVSASNEFFEFFEHVVSFESGSVNGSSSLT